MNERRDTGGVLAAASAADGSGGALAARYLGLERADEAGERWILCCQRESEHHSKHHAHQGSCASRHAAAHGRCAESAVYGAPSKAPDKRLMARNAASNGLFFFQRISRENSRFTFVK